MIQQTPQQRAEQRARREALVEKTVLHLNNMAPERIFSAGQLTLIDEWIAGQNDPAIERSEAIRRLVELGLKQKDRRSNG